MENLSASIREHHKSAQAAMRSGKLRDAHQHCLAILKLDQTHADAWFLCGVIAQSNGQAGKAVEIFRRALALEPDKAEYLAEMARALIAIDEITEALTTASRALDRNPARIPTLATLGSVFSHGGSHELALDSYERALTSLAARGADRGGLSPGWCAELYYNFGSSLEFAGRTSEAVEAFERAIELEPHFYRAHFALSLLQRATPGHNHLARLRSLLERAGGSVDRLHLGHAIAKELEDLGNLAESLETLRKAKAGRAAELGYHSAQDRALFGAVESGFTESLFAEAAPGCNNARPIFVVGMPRTGTTLVERILGSHSAVTAAGELPDIPLAVKRMAATPSAEVLDPETLRTSTEFDFQSLGEAYINSTQSRSGTSLYFVDKLPLNFLYLGLIHLALPNARLICLRRDPMDTCLSNYRQLFATKFKHYYYSYDLLDCGRYYLQFDQLMRHWQQVMPGAVHEVQYESLVADPVKVARELLAFCTLDWEDHCLEFHRQQGSVATPSAAQVRQPIYSSSVDRWQKYGDSLQPLYDLLSSAGCYRD